MTNYFRANVKGARDTRLLVLQTLQYLERVLRLAPRTTVRARARVTVDGFVLAFHAFAAVFTGDFHKQAPS